MDAKRRRKRVMRGVGLALGVGLLGAMLVYSLASSAGRADWSGLGSADPMHGAILLSGVVAQVFLSGLLFWVVTLSFDARPRVKLGEMVSVITLSAAANYLPMTGAVGRAAYMRLRHELPVRQSVLIQFVVIGLSVLVSAVAVALLSLRLPGATLAGVAAVVFAMLAMAAGTAASRALGRPVVAGWAWVVIRVAELFVSSVRLWAAFAIMGFDASLTQVVACSAAGFFVSLTGLTPNGLGLREWAVAAVSHMISPEMGVAAAAASLVDRAAEVIVFALGGAIAAKRLGWQELKMMMASESEN